MPLEGQILKWIAGAVAVTLGVAALGLTSADQALPQQRAKDLLALAASTADPQGAHVPEPPVLKAQYFLALAMYHEARGQDPDAMRAVGWVVMNRARSEQFPDGIHDVVMQPTRSGKCQFGWACGDYEQDLATDPSWRQAQNVAEQLLLGGGRDPTRGAIWFWESWRPRPSWLGRDVRQTLELGGHSFYTPNRLG
jgi:spore germination cell wall hydrolase CwlJ-like protein